MDDQWSLLEDVGSPVVTAMVSPSTKVDAETMKLQSLLEALRGCLDERTGIHRLLKLAVPLLMMILRRNIYIYTYIYTKLSKEV